MTGYEHEKGSFTIEASMIFSVIVLAVIAIMFTFSYMQQKSYLMSAASYAAQQGAELWLDSRKLMDNGRVNYRLGEDPISYRVFDNLLLSRGTYDGYIEEIKTKDGKYSTSLVMDTDGSLPGRKALLVGEALCKKLSCMVIKPEYTKVRVTFSNSIIRQKLSVEIMQEIKIPFGGVKRFFDGKETVTLVCRSEAAVTEPDEYIRNIDLAVELSKKLEGRLDFEGLLNVITSNSRK